MALGRSFDRSEAEEEAEEDAEASSSASRHLASWTARGGDAAPWGAHAKPAISSSFEGTS
jgi:hypothetical protein